MQTSGRLGKSSPISKIFYAKAGCDCAVDLLNLALNRIRADSARSCYLGAVPYLPSKVVEIP